MGVVQRQMNGQKISFGMVAPGHPVRLPSTPLAVQQILENLNNVAHGLGTMLQSSIGGYIVGYLETYFYLLTHKTV